MGVYFSKKFKRISVYLWKASFMERNTERNMVRLSMVSFGITLNQT